MYDMTAPPPQSFSSKMSSFFRSLNCCGGSADDDSRSMIISGPTNFRREDISMPGLSPEQQQEIREKARADAEKMWKGLQPLASSPSTQFAERPLPTFEQFVTPRRAPVPGSKEDGVSNNNTNNNNNNSPGVKQSPTVTVDSETMNGQRISGGHNWSNSIRVHSRKISDALSKPLGYDKGLRNSREGSPYEMRALMDPSRTAVGGAPQEKMSADSFSVDDSEGEAMIGERDSGKAMRRGPAAMRI
ncbi:hypothetical protein Q7P36_008573 [Cladosporium allicinum]